MKINTKTKLELSLEKKVLLEREKNELPKDFLNIPNIFELSFSGYIYDENIFSLKTFNYEMNFLRFIIAKNLTSRPGSILNIIRYSTQKIPHLRHTLIRFEYLIKNPISTVVLDLLNGFVSPVAAIEFKKIFSHVCWFGSFFTEEKDICISFDLSSEFGISVRDATDVNFNFGKFFSPKIFKFSKSDTANRKKLYLYIIVGEERENCKFHLGNKSYIQENLSIFIMRFLNVVESVAINSPFIKKKVGGLLFSSPVDITIFSYLNFKRSFNVTFSILNRYENYTLSELNITEYGFCMDAIKILLIQFFVDFNVFSPLKRFCIFNIYFKRSFKETFIVPLYRHVSNSGQICLDTVLEEEVRITDIGNACRRPTFGAVITTLKYSKLKYVQYGNKTVLLENEIVKYRHNRLSMWQEKFDTLFGIDMELRRFAYIFRQRLFCVRYKNILLKQFSDKFRFVVKFFFNSNFIEGIKKKKFRLMVYEDAAFFEKMVLIAILFYQINFDKIIRSEKIWSNKSFSIFSNISVIKKYSQYIILDEQVLLFLNSIREKNLIENYSLYQLTKNGVRHRLPFRLGDYYFTEDLENAYERLEFFSHENNHLWNGEVTVPEIMTIKSYEVEIFKEKRITSDVRLFLKWFKLGSINCETGWYAFLRVFHLQKKRYDKRTSVPGSWDIWLENYAEGVVKEIYEKDKEYKYRLRYSFSRGVESVLGVFRPKRLSKKKKKFYWSYFLELIIQICAHRREVLTRKKNYYKFKRMQKAKNRILVRKFLNDIYSTYLNKFI